MTGGKIQSLQVLRALAAVMIVYLHAGNASDWYLGNELWESYRSAFWGAGVDVFFVLSGAIIYQSTFAHRRASPGDFLRKRFLRIAPLYYLATLVWLAFYPLFHGSLRWQDIATAAAFWPVWGSGVSLPTFATGWTLSFEMLFYAGVALTLVSQRFLLLLLAIFATCGALAWAGITQLQFVGSPMICEFLLGVAIMHHFARSPATIRPLWFGWGLVIVGLIAAFVLSPTPGFESPRFTIYSPVAAAIRASVWGGPAGIVLIGALIIEPHLQTPWRVAVYLGDASYSIYLFHILALTAAAMLLPLPSNWTGHVILCAVGIIAGVLVYEFIERPMLKFFRHATSSANAKKLSFAGAPRSR